MERRGRRRLAAQLEHARGIKLAHPQFELDQNAEYPAVRLDEEGNPKIRNLRPAWDEMRHQYYMAHVVANLCRWFGRQFEPGKNYTRVFRNGMYDVLNARLDALLRAVRAIDVGDCPDALLSVANCNFRDPFAGRSAAVLLLHRLAEAIRYELTAEDLVKAGQRIRTETTSGREKEPLEIDRGNIKLYSESNGYGFISGNVFFRIEKWRSATLPSVGEAVEFQSIATPKGRRAVWVRSLV